MTKLPEPRYSKNVEAQWGPFDLTGIQMSVGLSLSISDFKGDLVKNDITKGARGEQILSFQAKRGEQVCSVPEEPLWERASDLGPL